MALYSGSLKTAIIDDLSFNQNKVEFRFDRDTMYYSNLRLIDLGVKGTATKYNGLSGCFGCIKHIALLDGRQKLDELRFANRYLSWNNLLATNAHNRDAEGRLTKNEIGYSVNEVQLIVPGCAPNPDQQTENNTIDAQGLKPSLGSLDLRKCLPILNKMNTLDTALFENLRVQIEFEADARNIIISQAAGDSQKINCVLLADEITDEKLADANRRAMGAVVWSAIDHDVFQVPDNKTASNALADGGSVVQEVNHKVRGFDNKIVDRIVMMKAFSDKTKHIDTNNVVGYGDMGSMVQFRERLNITKNGARVFNENGISKNAIDALLSDTFGEINIAPFQSKTAQGLDDKHNNAVHKAGILSLNANNQNDTVGQLHYMGCTLSDRINDLEINYQRTNVKDTSTVQKYNEGLNVHIYAECSKSLIPVKGGSYIVRYN